MGFLDEILSLMKEISTDSEVTKFLPIYTVERENEAQHFEGQIANEVESSVD